MSFLEQLVFLIYKKKEFLPPKSMKIEEFPSHSGGFSTGLVYGLEGKIGHQKATEKYKTNLLHMGRSQ